MSMLKSPQARMCCLFSIIDSMLSQLLAFVAIMLMKQFGRHRQRTTQLRVGDDQYGGPLCNLLLACLRILSIEHRNSPHALVFL